MAIRATEHLERLKRDAREVMEEARALVDGLSERQLLWRPAPDRWGVADCFEHLVATGAAYEPGIRDAITNGPAADGDAVYRPRLFGKLFIHSAGPNGKMRVPALGPFNPPPASPDAPRRFLEEQETLISLISDAAGTDLQKARVPSPLSSLLKLTLGECLTVAVVHQQRHLGQARRVLEAEGFPSH